MGRWALWLILLFGGCRFVRHLSEPQPVIYYLEEFNLQDLSRALPLIRAEPNPNLFIVGWADGAHGLFLEELDLASLFKHCGLDGLWMKEGFLLLGRDRILKLRDSSQAFLLGVDLPDLGPGYFTQDLSGLRIGIAGLSRPKFRFKEFKIEDPGYALRRSLPLMRSRADLIGVLGDSIGGVDFQIRGEKGRLARIVLGPGSPRTQFIQITPNLAQDSTVLSHILRLDSLLAQPIIQSEEDLGLLDLLSEALLASPGVDGVAAGAEYRVEIPAGTTSLEELLSYVPLYSGWPVVELGPRERVGLDLRYREGVKSDTVLRVAVDWQTYQRFFPELPFDLTPPIPPLLKEWLGDTE